MKIPHILFSITALITCVGVQGALISENFESSSGSTPPSGWSLIQYAGAASYTTATGSNGSGGDAGGQNAGQVSSSDFDGTNVDLPGAYLMNNTVLNISSALTVSFDFMLVQEGTFDDVVFVIGDIADKFQDSSAGELLSVKLAETQTNGGFAASLSNGLGGEPESSRLDTDPNVLADDTWYHGTFSWTPTAGTTGNASFTVNNFTSDVATLSVNDFVFDSSSAQIGFGSVNDTIRFDNIIAVPEPSSFAMLGLIGLAAIIGLRRRS